MVRQLPFPWGTVEAGVGRRLIFHLIRWPMVFGRLAPSTIFDVAFWPCTALRIGAVVFVRPSPCTCLVSCGGLARNSLTPGIFGTSSVCPHPFGRYFFVGGDVVMSFFIASCRRAAVLSGGYSASFISPFLFLWFLLATTCVPWNLRLVSEIFAFAWQVFSLSFDVGAWFRIRAFTRSRIVPSLWKRWRQAF